MDNPRVAQKAPNPASKPFVLRHSRVSGACVATAVLHAVTIPRPLGPDEGGFAVMAEYWREPGPHLYGPLWVDRPPGLIAIFDLGNSLGPYGVRFIAAACALIVVIAVACAAATVAGPRAATWSAWTAAALTSTTLLQSHQLTGELAGSAFVAISVAALLIGRRLDGQGAVLVGCSSGVAAAAAVLVKQNLIGAIVFAGVLAAATYLARRWTPGTTALVGGFGLGVTVSVSAPVLWAADRGVMRQLWYAVFEFRGDAARVMDDWSWEAPAMRLGALLVIAIATAMLPLAVVLGAAVRGRPLATSPLAAAIAATLGFQLVAMVVGLVFWPHYLISFTPMLALSAGLVAVRTTPAARWTRRIVVAAVVSAAIVTPGTALAFPPSQAYVVGTWVKSSAAARDSIVVTYTHANVVHASALKPAYPYLWSLPARTLDPQGQLLATTLKGADRPTWVVTWDRLNRWQLDPRRDVRQGLTAHYRRVALICGRPIWLREDVSRALAPAPEECGGGAL